MHTRQQIQRESLLQEGVSCALATLYAIESGDLFRALPSDETAQKQHGHGSWLLAMLEDQLTRIQQQVDAFDAAASAAQTGS